MRTNNQMGVGEYFGMHLVYLFIGYIWHSELLFECLPGVTYKVSKLVMWMLLLLFCGFFYALTYEKKRTSMNALINVLFSLESYSFLVFSKTMKSATFVATMAAVFLMLLLGYGVFCREIGPGADRKKVIFRRITGWLLASRTIMMVAMTVVVGFSFFSIVLGGNMMYAKTEAAISKNDESEWRVSKQVDRLKVLKQETWETLSDQEKLDVLQIIANIEERYLGIGHELNVGAKPLEKNALGQYLGKTHTISIDLEHLQTSTAKELVSTLLHECRHAYQQRAVEALSRLPEEYYSLFMFYEVCLFQRGYENYGDDSPEGYIINEVEIDARQYAKENLKMFYDELNRCLAKEENADE